MRIHIAKDPVKLGELAGRAAAKVIMETVEHQGNANIILATGTSQFETLNYLIDEKRIEWGKVVMFHLDEYIGLSSTHLASFRKYLKERFLSKVGPLKAVHLIDGETNAKEECERLSTFIRRHPIDVALVGIGENGHLAFNDPPADFDTEDPYIIVDLDEACRAQQYGEGWFDSVDQVPRQAISMSIRQILKSRNIICSVPDKRKALAVKQCLEQPVTNLYPASILLTHANCSIFLDSESANDLRGNGIKKVNGFPYEYILGD